MIMVAAFLLLAQATGTVTDSVTHLPIRGAKVKTADSADVVTGDDGGYTIPHPGSGEVQFWVAAKGYRSLETKARIAGGGFVKLDIELHPMGRIKGKIVDQDSGEPVPGFVILQPKAGGLPKLGGVNSKDGAFDIDGMESGDYTLELRGHPYRNFVYPGTIHVEEGQEQVLDIRLPTVPLYRVKGVIEVPEGRESEALTVTVRDDLDSRTGTDMKHPGPFSIERLTPGHYTLSAMLGRGADKLYGELSVSVTDHDIDGVKLKLLPTASLTATIQMAEDGVAAPEDAELTLFKAGGGRPGAAGPVSLHDGRFRIEGIPPGRYWPQLNHLPSGYAQLMAQIGLYGPTDLSLMVTSKPGTIVCTVRDENQAPVDGETVVLVPDSGMGKLTKSGATGEFRFSDVAPGKYTVNGVSVEVGPGQTVTVDVHRVKT